MTRTTYSTVADWLDVAAPQFHADGLVSAHFDCFTFMKHNPHGIECLSYAVRMLGELGEAVEKLDAKPLDTSAFVVFPLGCVESIGAWEDSHWSRIGADQEPPSIYLSKRYALFDVDDEEYRRPVGIPSQGSIDMVAIYRCSRSAEAMRNGWEFNSAIYLILS